MEPRSPCPRRPWVSGTRRIPGYDVERAKKKTGSAQNHAEPAGTAPARRQGSGPLANERRSASRGVTLQPVLDHHVRTLLGAKPNVWPATMPKLLLACWQASA